jgi:MFS family permease
MVKEFIKLSPIWLLVFFTATNLLIYIDRGILSSVLTILSHPEDPVTPLSNPGEADSINSTVSKDLIPGLSLDESEQGSLGSLFMLGFMIGAPLFAHYSQTFHPFNLIGVGMSIWCFSAFLATGSFSYFQLMVSRIFSGVGEASFVSLAPPIIMDAASDKNKSTWIAIFYSTIALGYALGYLIGGFAVDLSNDWRWGFLIEGILGLVIVFVCFFAEKDPKMIAKRKEKKKDKAKGKDKSQALSFLTQFQKLYSNPLFVFIVLGFTAFVFTLGAFGFWIPTIFKLLFSTTEDFGNILSGLLTLIFGVIGTLLGSIILDLLIKSFVDVSNMSTSKKEKLLKHKYTQFSLIFLVVTTLIGCLAGVIGTATQNFWGFTIGFAIGEFCIFL